METVIWVLAGLILYFLAGYLVLSYCEEKHEWAMDQVVGFSAAGGVVCSLAWPWTWAVVMTLVKAERKPAVRIDERA